MEAGGRTETLWVAFSLVVGFLVVGAFVGSRVAAAPLLHGLGMGLFSLLAWLLVNLFVGEPLGQTTWRSLNISTFAGLLALQVVSAGVGTRIGVRWVRRGGGRQTTGSSG
jgi:hypothetical protein